MLRDCDFVIYAPTAGVASCNIKERSQCRRFTVIYSIAAAAAAAAAAACAVRSGDDEDGRWRRVTIAVDSCCRCDHLVD